MRKLFGYIFSPVHYLLFGLILCIFHPIQWLALKIGGYSAHKISVDLLNLATVGTYYALGSSIRFQYRHELPVNQPIIFVANHQSLYDIPPLIWFLRRHHAKFISKIELTKGIPSVSFNLRHGGGANIDRNDSKQAVAEIIKLGQKMKANRWSTVIFPEGTRSRNGRLKPFAVGGIATLLKKCPEAIVVPVAIDGSWRLVRYGAFPLSFGEKLSWTVLEPITPGNLPVEEIVSLAENRIRTALGQTADS